MLDKTIPAASVLVFALVPLLLVLEYRETKAMQAKSLGMSVELLYNPTVRGELRAQGPHEPTIH